MSTMTPPSSALQGFGAPAQDVCSWRDALIAAVTRWRARARADAELRTLSELSDATLRDIGLAERMPSPRKPSPHEWTLVRW